MDKNTVFKIIIGYFSYLTLSSFGFAIFQYTKNVFISLPVFVCSVSFGSVIYFYVNFLFLKLKENND